MLPLVPNTWEPELSFTLPVPFLPPPLPLMVLDMVLVLVLDMVLVLVLDAWEPGDARPTILHSHRLLDHLRQPGARRLTDAETIWVEERLSLVEEWVQAGIEGERSRDFDRLLSILGARQDI